MKKQLVATAFVVFMLLSATISLFGQDNALELNSPRQSSLGLSTAGTESPYDDTVNPAASAGTQRTTLDFSYFLIPGF